jgi:hypothetical protein
VEGAGTGADGTDESLEAAQQGILQECPPWQQQQQHFAPGAVFGLAGEDMAVTGQMASIKPKSATAAIFVIFQIMPVVKSAACGRT